jgi:hypothetical protein
MKIEKQKERERERESEIVCTILAADQQQPTQPKANKNTNCEYSTLTVPMCSPVFGVYFLFV